MEKTRKFQVRCYAGGDDECSYHKMVLLNRTTMSDKKKLGQSNEKPAFNTKLTYTCKIITEKVTRKKEKYKATVK